MWVVVLFRRERPTCPVQEEDATGTNLSHECKMNPAWNENRFTGFYVLSVYPLCNEKLVL